MMNATQKFALVSALVLVALSLFPLSALAVGVKTSQNAFVHCGGSLVNGESATGENLAAKHFKFKLQKKRSPSFPDPQEIGTLGDTSFSVQFIEGESAPLLEVNAIGPGGEMSAAGPILSIPMAVTLRSTTNDGNDLIVECQLVATR